MSDIDNLLEELVKNISAKLDDQQKEIDALKSQVKNQNDEFHKLLSANQNHLNVISSKINDTSVKISEANTNLAQVTDLSEIKQQMELIKNQILELKNNEVCTTGIKDNDRCSHLTETLKYHDDLTQLPAFAKTEIFKEIRRPVNLNELYMVVLQSARTINELQMNVDNICRRN